MKAVNHVAPFIMVGSVSSGKCLECAAAHDQEQPHNNQSLTYQYAFYAKYGRWPTCTDALAHCSEDIKAYGVAPLREKEAEA